MTKIVTQHGYIYLKPSENVKKLASNIPCARWVNKHGCYVFPITRAIAANIVNTLSVQQNEADDEFWKLTQSVPTCDISEIPGLTTNLWEHQASALEFIQENDACLLEMGMGVGKTIIVIAHILLNKFQRVLIVTPNKVTNVWPYQFKLHSNNHDVIIANFNKGTSTERAKSLTEASTVAASLGRQLVCIINYESVFRKDFAKVAIGEKWDLIVCDEVHRLKAPNGKASRFMSRMADKTQRRLGLSGTIMPNSPMDIYGSYRFIDKGIFGKNVTLFRARYAIENPHIRGHVVGFQNIEELKEKYKSISFYVSRDVLSLPDAVASFVEVELQGDAKKKYDKLYQDFTIDLKENAKTALDLEGLIVATNVLARITRLQQITSGHVRDVTGEYHNVDCSKFKALLSLLSDISKDEKIVIAHRFRPEIKDIELACKDTDRAVGFLNGDRDDLVEGKFPEDKDVMVVQIQSGAEGIDLTAANHCIFYSLVYSLGVYDQFCARVHRPGQNKKVHFQHLLAKDTIDEAIYASIIEKKNLIQSIVKEVIGG